MLATAEGSERSHIRVGFYPGQLATEQFAQKERLAILGVPHHGQAVLEGNRLAVEQFLEPLGGAHVFMAKR